MASPCPECGGELRPSPEGEGLGTCVVCGESFIIVPGKNPAPRPAPPEKPQVPGTDDTDADEDEDGEEDEWDDGEGAEGPDGEVSEERADRSSGRGPRRDAGPRVSRMGSGCLRCGAPLELTQVMREAVRGRCPECEATFRFVLEDRRARPSREAPRGFRREGGRNEPSGARGCRRCGGQIQFTERADGGLQGECRNCGNRFVLRQRREPGRFGSSRPFRREYAPPRDRGFRPGEGGGRSFSEERRRPRRRRTDEES